MYSDALSLEALLKSFVQWWISLEVAEFIASG